MNAEIEKLLLAQKVDQERLRMIQSLEKGKEKSELDRVAHSINASKETLLRLEKDAQKLQDDYQKYAKVIVDTMQQLEKAQASHSEDAALYSDFLTKLTMLQGQLADIESRIAQKTAAFKTTSLDVAKASGVLKTLIQKYEAVKKIGEPKIKALEQEFAEKTKGINEKLLAKYAFARKSKGNDIKDVVVPLTVDNCCQGCFMNLPVAMVNKIKSEGWTVCDECGRIIYEA